MEAEVSAPSGFIVAPVNAGEIVNEGIELMIGVNPVRTANFRWDIDANFTQFENTVTESGEVNTTPVDFANPANGTSGIKWKRNGFLGLAEDNIEDGSWGRLRELILSWTMPKLWFDSFFLQGATLTFSGRNLWLDTDYFGVDPETNLRGDTNDTGWDYFNLPNTKSYTFSLNLNF